MFPLIAVFRLSMSEIEIDNSSGPISLDTAVIVSKPASTLSGFCNYIRQQKLLQIIHACSLLKQVSTAS